MTHASFAERLDKVRREDLLLFLNAGLTATGQGGFYHGPERLSLTFLHSYMAENYRELNASMLAAGLSDHNLAHSLYTLLSSGAPEEPEARRKENALIEMAVRRLPPQRAYRLFERLANGKVNNRRARATVRGYLKWRKSLFFDAVKYRKRLKAAVLHAHVPVQSELQRFLFLGAKAKLYSDPLLETYRRAHYDQRALYELPFSVAQGLAARHRVPREQFLKKIAPRMTEREKLRWQRAGAESFDPARADLVELCLYFLRLPIPERPPLLKVLRERAQTLTGEVPPSLRELSVATVLDCSYSSLGSATARRRPLALALAVHLTLEAACSTYSAHWSEPVGDLCELTPSGQTALGGPLLDALERRPDVVIAVSDARENAPSGAAQAIAAAVEGRLSKAPQWLHLNPVFDPDDFSPMGLGADWPTVGLRRVEDLSSAFAMARFVREEIDVTELETYFSRLQSEVL